MTAQETKNLIKQTRFVPILRTKNASPLIPLAQAIVNAEISILELTMTIPGVLDSLAKIKSDYPDLTLGIGTVTTPEQARLAIQSGADFIVSPAFLPDLVDPVKKQDKLLILAGLTPTEIYQAHRVGSDIVKVFPASVIEPSFMKELHGPFPTIDLLPTGGLSLLRGLQFLNHGAFAIGLGGTLFDQTLIAKENFDAIEIKLKNILQRIKKSEI